jgi:two-component system, LytTR family, sensor histidine kinase AlgZ
MHPILARRERLFAYLLAWLPGAAIVGYVLALPGRLGWREALLLAVPLSLVYAFLCLSSWYACRSAPLQRVRGWTLAATHGAGALVAAALWTLCGSTLASALAMGELSDLPERFSGSVPALFVLGVLVYLLSVALHYVLFSLESSQAAERREAEMRVLAREAELEALKARLNPHFLFNSLNSVSALTTSAPARAREMCVLLSEFLRASLAVGEKGLIPLSEELSLVRQFLAIEKVRFGRRLDVVEEVDEEAASTLVPPLLLQPLVENAVKHGIGTLLDGGTVTLRVKRTADGVAVVVENPFDPAAEAPAREGLGLALVSQRLKAHHGRRAQLVSRVVEDRYRVELLLPAPEAAP